MAELCPNINKKLLLIKLVMVGWFGATACNLPFMSVHMRELGISLQETAIIYTLLPITQFLATPLAGFIADRFGKYRDSLLVSIVASVFLCTAMLYVPPNFSPGQRDFPILQCTNGSDSSNSTTIWLATSSCDEVCFDNCKILCSEQTVNTTTILLKSIQPTEVNESCKAPVLISVNESVDVCSSETKNCSLSCRTEACLSDREGGSASLTFWLYTTIRIAYNIFCSIAFALVDSTAIALTERHGDEEGETSGHYGRQRLWAMISVGVFSPIAGLLVDVWSGQEQLNYAPAFHAYNVLALLTAIAAWRLEIQVPSKVPNIRELGSLFGSAHILCLLLVVFWLGTVWGFLETFLFWFLVEELHSPNYLLGLTLTAGCFAGIPFLHWSRYIVEKVGNVELLCVALAAYLVRCVGYSFLYDGWWCMPFEVLEIFTYHLMWVVTATYAARITPKTLLATVQGSIGGLHYGVGQGSGSLIGGTLMSAFGARAAFQMMAGISGVMAVLYAVLYYCWLKKIEANKNSSEKFEEKFGESDGKHAANPPSIEMAINGDGKASK